MTVDVFLASVKSLAEGKLTLAEVIGAADALNKSANLDLAVNLYQLWIGANAGSPLLYAARFNLAGMLSACNRLDEARDALEKAIAQNPNFYPPYINLGGIHERMGDPQGAIDKWRSLVDRLGVVTGNAVEMKATALKQIARLLEETQRITEAEDTLLQSLELDNDQRENIEHLIAARLVQCKWPVVPPTMAVDRDVLVRGFSPLSLAAYTDDPMFHLANAWDYTRRNLGLLNPRMPLPPQRTEADGQRRLRIGYVSSDLRAHAVGYLMAEFFGLHDRSRFEIFVYYCGPGGEDVIKQRTRQNVEHWTDITPMSDDAAARAIQADGIDILIDLNGHTKGSRTRVFGMRPAPINVNWLGYPGTMGSPYHHYIIADDWIIPPSHECYYSEKVLRLPCYQPNDSGRMVGASRPSRADVGLPDDAMVFCCFNGLQKVNRPTFERWLSILHQVPNSVLWLLDGGGDGNDRLVAMAEAGGIERRRVIFADRLPSADHLARMPLADLFLDTFPYGAHTTASDALWMGVPILTLSGNSFASRVCGSLARSAGLPELVCESPDDYVALAVALGTDRARLAACRDQLAQRRDGAVLFDSRLLVDRLERLYEQMWADFRNGILPLPDLANMDVYFDLGAAHAAQAESFEAEADYRARILKQLAERHHLCAVATDTRLWTAPPTADAAAIA